MTTRKNIAIIGTGISGLGAAHTLCPHHDVTLYEKNDYVGGHSKTVTIPTPDGPVAVDMGFIVFNKRNYPMLTRLFEALEVPVAKSDMSFGASIRDGWLEYGTRRAGDIFAQKSNLLRPAYWAMLRDITRFNAKAGAYLNHPPSFTLGQCLDELGMGPWFRDYFLLAMGGAIWSTPLQDMLKFPAATFIRFFDNHGLLTINDHPQWYTVRGGSREYVERLIQPFKDRIRLDCGVRHVRRAGDTVVVTDTKGQSASYDEVIFACHADQALSMIDAPTPQEREILGAFRYQPNRVVLHTDTSFMPRRRNAWASWVYLSEGVTDTASCVSLSYWMNNLQPLPTTQPLIVTLNPGRNPDPATIHVDLEFEHPVFDTAAIENQSRIADIQGRDRFWFCGAYTRYGFHEDGLASAVDVALRMGIKPAW